MLTALRNMALALAISAAGVATAYAQDVPNVAAASDLKFALEEVAAKFQQGTGRQVKISFGSSGNFFRQISQGAPFQLFLSADENFIRQLAESKLALDEGALYAIGRIALVVPRTSSIRADAQLKDLAAAVDDGRLKKFAIANPEHAPYGQAARDALQRAGLWERMQNRLVLGENVSQAAQFATSGATQGGIVAYSLALSPQIAEVADHALLPASSHRPLRQRMALMKNAGETATAFYRYMQQPAARAILKRHGFLLPGEE